MEPKFTKIVSKLTIAHHKGEGKYCGNTTRILTIDASGVNEHVEVNGDKGDAGWDSHGGVDLFVMAEYVPDMDEAYKTEYQHTFVQFDYEFETERVIYNIPTQGMKLSIKRLQPHVSD